MINAKKFIKRYKKVVSIELELFSEIELMNNDIEDHLGEGWAVVQQTDGFCLVDEDANNYLIAQIDFEHLFSLSRSRSISYLMQFAI